MSVLTPNMGLVESTVGTDTGLSWEQNLNASLNILDGHNHSPGSGIQITPSGINLNASLPFNSNAALSIAYVGLSPQGGSVPTPIDLSLYASGGELFYQDASGNDVQITKAGSVNATSSGISSGTATASFVSSILVVDQNVGVGAPIDAATYILRYNGSYPSPSGNYIALQAPTSLASGFAITFPNSTPVASSSFIAADTSGNLSYLNVDNSTLTIASSTVSVGALGIQTGNIANGAVTGPKKAALNFVQSAEVTTSTTVGFTPVSGLSVTITTSGRPVQIMMMGGTSLGQSTLSGLTTTGTGALDVGIFRSDLGFVFTSIQLVGTAGTQFSPSSVSFVDTTTPSAGTYTYQIYWGTNNAAGMTRCTLAAYEL